MRILEQGRHPYVVRISYNNGQKGYINEDEIYLNEGNTISFGQDTATMFYQEQPYFTGDKIKVLKSRYKQFGKNNAQFFISALTKTFSTFSWGTSNFDADTIGKQIVKLPIKDNIPDFNFMDYFISRLKVEELKKLEVYLSSLNLKSYEITNIEQQAIDNYKNLIWSGVKLGSLFGKATRGKRLKSADRIPGALPFVTAGEADAGVSDFIGNDVQVFSKNTITIDMFGSAKYRNYCYGADDHIAVVHTENLHSYASIFITAAIHKASYNGQFNYGKNFYAKDADELEIMLPTVNGLPDYDYMQNVVSAIHKIVIKNLSNYYKNNNYV